MIPEKRASEEELKLMEHLGITQEVKSVYLFQGYKYERLSDAIRYAKRSNLASELTPDLPSSG